jgi:hypothetical protein
MACGAGNGSETNGDSDPPGPDPDIPEEVSQVGETRATANHEVTLVGVEVFPSALDDDDYPELLVVELFIDNTSQGDVSYDLLYPYALFLAEDRIAFEALDCDGRAPVGRMFLDAGTSTTYYLCWYLPPLEEAPTLILTYDYTRELVDGDEVQWLILR